MEYKIGDKVKVRTWEDMKKEFGLGWGDNIKCRCAFTESMRKYCGKIVTIKGSFDGFDHKYKIYRIKEDGGYWSWSDDMFEDEIATKQKELNKIILQEKDVVFIDYGDGSISEMEVIGWAGSKANEIAGTVIKILRKGKTIYKTNKPINEFFFKGNKTIYYDANGKRTVVKCCKDDTYDKKMGVLYAIAKANGYTWKDIEKICEEPKQNKEIDWKVGNKFVVVNNKHFDKSIENGQTGTITNILLKKIYWLNIDGRTQVIGDDINDCLRRI